MKHEKVILTKEQKEKIKSLKLKLKELNKEADDLSTKVDIAYKKRNKLEDDYYKQYDKLDDQFCGLSDKLDIKEGKISELKDKIEEIENSTCRCKECNQVITKTLSK